MLPRVAFEYGQTSSAVLTSSMAATPSSIDSSVNLMPTQSRGYALAVTLAVSLPSIADAGEAVELVRAAHEVCPYSNATRGNIDVVLTANGDAVETADTSRIAD